MVECDPAKSEDTRRNWPFFRDRRIDAFGGITERWVGRRSEVQEAPDVKEVKDEERRDYRRVR